MFKLQKTFMSDFWAFILLAYAKQNAFEQLSQIHCTVCYVL